VRVPLSARFSVIVRSIAAGLAAASLALSLPASAVAVYTGFPETIGELLEIWIGSMLLMFVGGLYLYIRSWLADAREERAAAARGEGTDERDTDGTKPDKWSL
jgi:hypothetical protein